MVVSNCVGFDLCIVQVLEYKAVGAISANQQTIVRTAIEGISAETAAHRIVTGQAEHLVVAGQAVDFVTTGIAYQIVPSAGSIDDNLCELFLAAAGNSK